jgi:hypothetical protein
VTTARRAAGAVLLLVLGAVLAAGCTVSEPDTAEWTELATTSLTDAASEVATVRLTLAAERDGQVWSAYAVTVAAEAEEAAATAEESLSTVQPPPGRADQATRLLDLLGRAVDAVRAAREVIVSGEVANDAMLRRLDDLSAELERQAQDL